MTPQLEQIRQTLEREIPEIRTGDAVGILFGFVISASLTGLLGITVYFFTSMGMGNEPTGFGCLVAGLLSLPIGYFIGQATSGSHEVPGSELIEEGMELRESWFHRERGNDLMVAGTVLFFSSFVFGGLYSTIDYMRKRGKLSDDNRSRIAAGIVAYLLEKRAVPQSDLVASLEEQGVPGAQVRHVLAVLTRNGFLEANAERMWVSPEKRHHF